MASLKEFDFNLFRAMEVFSAVVETRHVTQAAKLLGMTQSAASQHIHSLEQALNAQLVDRSVRPIRITLAGIALHQRSQRIFTEIEELQTEVRRLDGSIMPLLRIALLPSIATTLTPTLIEQARNNFSIQEVSVQAEFSNAQQQLLSAREVDLLITSDAYYDIDALERHSLLTENFLLILPPDHPQPRSIMSLTKTLPFIRFSSNTPVGRHINQHLRRVNVELSREIELDRTTMLMATVESGQGFAILSPTLLLDGIIEGMKLSVYPLPFAPLKRNLTLVSRKNELGELPAKIAGLIQQKLKHRLTSKLNFLPEGTIVFEKSK